MLSGLFGHADLTVSDLLAALVLTAAAQHQRRRLHIKNALAPAADNMTVSSATQDENADPDLGAPPQTSPSLWAAEVRHCDADNLDARARQELHTHAHACWHGECPAGQLLAWHLVDGDARLAGC